MEQRLLRDQRDVAERLADLADWARVMGHHVKANKLLLLAWAAYDEISCKSLLSQMAEERRCSVEPGHAGSAEIHQLQHYQRNGTLNR